MDQPGLPSLPHHHQGSGPNLGLEAGDLLGPLRSLLHLVQAGKDEMTLPFVVKPQFFHLLSRQDEGNSWTPCECRCHHHGEDYGFYMHPCVSWITPTLNGDRQGCQSA